ncbi:MAG: hypothetical protein QGM50_11915 [Anaerolineae bacterium]|nr:hypothetical protein [Anaerolineae bacterium]
MDTEKLIEHTDRLIQKAGNPKTIEGVYSEVAQFLRSYAGPKSEFLASVKVYNPRSYGSDYASKYISSVLISFKDYVKSGLLEELSPTRKAQIDVVSDFLEQAHTLLETSGVHPAAPAVLIGASLEEFLRNWIEEAGLSIGNKKPSLDSYAKTLRENELITKQDVKDITAWGGLRNHAAHGEWDQVSDKNRVMLMLEGINLFMRKYGG